MAVEGIANVEDIIADMAFDEHGMVAVIAQDWRTGSVLMMAWMNEEAIIKTASEGIAHYWSRSSQSLWRKGEKEGMQQHVKSFMLDRDRDTILLQVEEKADDVVLIDTGFYYYHIGSAGRYFLSGETPEIREPESLEY